MRFRQRHVHATLVDLVQQGLTARGWVNPPINFGVTPVTFMTVQPEQGGIAVPKNTVAISIGDEPADLPYEMGGLSSCSHVLFVDVYGEDGSTAASIASDVKALLKHKVIPLYDHTTAPPVATQDTIELDDVMISTPPVAASNVDKRFWRVVKAMAILYTQD